MVLGSGLACTSVGVKLTSPKETAKEDAMEYVIVFIKITLFNLVAIQIVLLSSK